MTSRVPFIWLVLLAMLLSGCDSAEDLVNRRLPPIADEPHHATAIQAAQAAIAEINDANAGFNLRIEDIAAAVKANGVTEGLGVVKLTLRGDRQLILAEADVTRTFAKDDFPDLDAETKSRIEILKPEIRGRISFGLGVTGAKVPSEDGRLTIDVRLRPLFRNMEVDHVALAGDVDVDLVITLMNRLADKVSGALGQVEIAKVSFPSMPFKQADLSRALAFRNADGVDPNITISAKPLSSSVYMRSVAWLVDGSNVTFIAELAPSGTAPAAGSTAIGKEDFAQLQAEFAAKLMEGLGIANPGDHWIAVSKRLVAQLVTTAFGQAQPCFGVKTTLPDRSFSSPMTIPDIAAVDCTPKIDCTPTKDCSTARNCRRTDECKPKRDCEVCALGACFNDPACERQKNGAQYNCEVRQAVRMIECERDSAPDKSACERDRAEVRALCETRKSATKLTCEAGRQSIEKLMSAANFANLAGRTGGSADLSVCLKEFAMAPSLGRLEASTIVNGEGVVDLDVKYVPRDIAGYFFCPFSWPEDKRIKITLTEPPARIDAALTLETSASAPALRATIKTSALAAHMRPSFRERLLGSYDMRAVCSPVGAMLNTVTVDATPSVPEINGDFSLPGEDRALVMALAPIAFRISGTNVVAEAAYVANAKALILNADRPAVPAN